ncbi:MAG: response regulator [Bacteroidia bacterium]|nr:response regulator [Bacteroidia bacterium]
MLKHPKLAIFIIEDDPYFGTLLSDKLRNMYDLKMYIYENGEDCIKNLYLNPDIILLDHLLPGMDGIKTLQEIKKKAPDMSVVFVSAQTSAEIAARSIQYGAMDYITKDRGSLQKVIDLIADKVLKYKDDKTSDYNL